MKGKLHETLAVEAELSNTDKKLRQESIRTFGKESLFQGQIRNLVMFADDQQFNNTTDRQELTSTIDENLNYLFPHISRYWNVVAQKDATNQVAKADIIVDGKTIFTQLSSTTLLGLETKLSELRKVFEAIPTLAPGILWKNDDQNRDGVYVTEHKEKSFKTEKDLQFKTAAPVTKEHPAQIVELNTTTNVGEYETTKWSGMYSPKRKAEVLDRLDILRNAIKKARMRANNTDIVDVQLGDILLNFIMD